MAAPYTRLPPNLGAGQKVVPSSNRGWGMLALGRIDLALPCSEGMISVAICQEPQLSRDHTDCCNATSTWLICSPGNEVQLMLSSSRVICSVTHRLEVEP